MKNLIIVVSSILFFALTISSCGTPETTEATATANTSLVNKVKSGDFTDYWYQGEAEVNSYHLEQTRYGEVRNGDAVFVFVTEDFSKSKQVKLDNSEEAGDDKVSVLKLNTLRKFHTGIYDYSMMASIFTPVDLKKYPHTLKTTTTSQDWCGHTFTQFNLEEDNYKITEFSYFESEGDKVIKTDDVLLEDELWTRLRINPGSIPEGNVELIPGTFFTRLKHAELKPKQAQINIQKGEGVSILNVVYLHLERSLTVRFESDFPFKILSFKENNSAGEVTQAVLKKTLKSAYWAKNSSRFANLRDSLELTY